MVKINQPIDEFITSLYQQGVEVVFCQGIKPQPQAGQTCKLVAGAVIQDYLHLQGHSLPSLPLHKNGLFNNSIRLRAKQTVNSQVGEVYGPKQMQKVFDYNNFKTISYCIYDKHIYQDFITQSLNQKQPMIAYFDVTPRIGPEDSQGTPNFFKGNFEHGTAIAGYYYLNSKMHLIVAQWGEFHDILFDDLFDSTAQLSHVKNPEHYQKYYPIPGMFNHKKWIEKEQMNLSCDYLCNYQQSFKRSVFTFLNYIWPKDKERVSAPPIDNSSSFVNVLTLITSDNRTIDLDEFDKYKLILDDEEEYVNRIEFI